VVYELVAHRVVIARVLPAEFRDVIRRNIEPLGEPSLPSAQVISLHGDLLMRRIGKFRSGKVLLANTTNDLISPERIECGLHWDRMEVP
jgi:hypothetical protein